MSTPSTNTTGANAELGRRLLGSLKERSREDLAALCSELLLTYVVQRRSPTIEQLGTMPVPRDLREMSFTQLVSWLKRNLSLPELDALEVQHGQVHAKLEGRLVPLRQSAPAGAEAPPPAVAPTRPGPPAATPHAEPTTPAARNVAPPPPGRSEAAPAPAAAADTQDAPADEGPSDRFSMLEID